MQKLLDKLHFWKSHYVAYLYRKKSIEKYIKTHKIKKLHVGCGSFIIDSWLNSDLYGNDTVVPIDLTKKLPFTKSTFDYIFSEHVIEHFTFAEGEYILREMFRILKHNGKIRIATPNLQFLIDLYNKDKTSTQKKFIKVSTDLALPGIDIYSDVFVINNFFRAWGHLFIYDFETLKWILKKIGFVNIKQYVSEESDDANLKNLELHWTIAGKEFNNLETFVVEATKPKK